MPLSPNRFRRHKQHGNNTHHPLIVVGVCLLVAILITAIVGNLLKIWLDDATYQKLTQGTPEINAPKPENETAVRNVNAYPFLLGGDVLTVGDKHAVSVNVNLPDGKVNYTSDVVQYLALPHESNVNLHETMSELCAFVPYVSGVFYPQAFLQSSADLRHAVASEEASLLREFVRAGGSEILLCGLPLDAQNLNAAVEYVSVIKSMLPNVAVGVAVPLAAATAEDAWETVGKLMKVCDFCALDLTRETVAAEPLDALGLSSAAYSLLSSCNYLITQYDMRVLLSSSQAPLLEYLEFYGYSDYQVID